MDCPYCSSGLESFTVDKTAIDICPDCGGAWLDAGELQECIAYLNRRRRFGPPASKTLLQKPVRLEDVQEPCLLCARCKRPMEKVNYLYSSNIIIDSCPGCGGIWLDKGEARKIASFSQASGVIELYGRAVVESLAEKCRQEKRQAQRIILYRIVSGLIACAYLAGSAAYLGAEDTVRLLGFLIVTLSFIWFGDELGAMTGYVYGYFLITKTTPGSIVRFMGWLILLMPIIFYVFTKAN